MQSFDKFHLKLTSPEQFSTLDAKSHDFVWEDLQCMTHAVHGSWARFISSDIFVDNFVIMHCVEIKCSTQAKSFCGNFSHFHLPNEKLYCFINAIVVFAVSHLIGNAQRIQCEMKNS